MGFEIKNNYKKSMPPKKSKERPEPNVEVPDGDPSAGRDVFDANCAACHAFEGDPKTASAPILGGVLGRKAGSTGFAYSKAMKGSGITWSKKHIFVYIKNPTKYIPGARMAFAGLDSEIDRANLLAYIEASA